MKSKLHRILSLLLLLCLAVMMAAPLTACNDDPDPTPTPDGPGDTPGDDTPVNPDGGEAATATYTVVVESVGGMPMKGVMVYIHDVADSNPYASVGRGKTDASGKITFTLPSDKTYNVELDDVPQGYKVNERYSFDATRTASVRLLSAPITDESIADLKDDFYYEIGDVIHDFTLEDINGKSWNVSDVLKEQQLLVLNLWYIGCSACVEEFPYMSNAYDKYNATHGNDGKNMIEIFAMNDHNDVFGQIKNFAENPVNSAGSSYGAFNFPVFKTEDSGFSSYSFIRKFFDTDSVGYPVSVFIDRYGVICCIEVGALVNEKYWTNAFDHFTADDYKQQLVERVEDLSPVEKPNVDMPSSEEIADAFSGNYRDTNEKITVTYRPEEDPDDAEYAWPFITTTLNGTPAIKPSNYDKDGSFAIIYTDIELKAGDALAFDYFSSCESTDVMYVLVDGKDIYSISGLGERDGEGNPIWETCCTYVAQNDGTYEIAFVYTKDIADYEGDDAIYLKNLRVIDQSEITMETYIYRFAATNPTADKMGFQNYASVVYNPEDGYYHVGTANGPLLLVNLLGYTNFDASKTVFDRLYAKVDENTGMPTFTVNGAEVFLKMEMHGSFAANSKMYGYAPVNEELRSYLEAYVDLYRRTVGKAANANLWLSLCSYYDAYGTDGKQLDNPIKGLSTQSAFEAKLDVDNTVTYETILMPRGYLYKFVPTVSGVYRVTSNSTSSVIGMIFRGDEGTWAENGIRTVHVDSEQRERLCPELTSTQYAVVCPDCEETVTVFKQFDSEGNEIAITEAVCHNAQIKGCDTITDLSEMEEVTVRDYRNVSMAGYMEAGEAYYITIVYHTVEELGSFTFNIKYVAPEFDQFVQASPGPFTFEEGVNGSIGSTIAGGIDVVLCDDEHCEACAEIALASGAEEGTKYYHSVNPDGTKGYVLFADFYQYTDTFQSQSILDLIEVNAFNFSASETDIVAYNLWKRYGEEGLREYWGKSFEENWIAYQMDDVINGIFHGKGEDRTDVVRQYVEKMLDEAEHPERQGCVAVTEELAEILDMLIHVQVFENVENGFTKFCYYYKHLGPAAE